MNNWNIWGLDADKEAKDTKIKKYKVQKEDSPQECGTQSRNDNWDSW